MSEPQVAAETLPKRWTLHRLNNSLIFGLTVRGVRVLPRAVSYGIGHAGTWLAWRLMRETNAAVAANLSAVMPETNESERRRAALRVYRHYAHDTIDFLRALSASPQEIERTFTLRDEDRRLFDGVLAEGRGALLVSGHYGNWEIGGLLMSQVVRLPLTVLAMIGPDEDVHRLRRDIRARMGVDTLEVRQSLDTALQIRRLLAENRFVAILIDRHMGRDRVRVNFFGRPTWFLQTPALLAYLTGAPIVTCFLERQAPGHFRTQAVGPIRVDRSLPRSEAVQQATQQIADILESRVRANPQAWYQFYRYWDVQNDDYAGLT
jgi:KDO2-lipid IV(A) lauroyltransferase